MRMFDIWFNYQYDMKFPKADPDCPTCRRFVYPSLHRQAADHETVLCGRNTVQIHQKSHMDLKKWENRLKHVAAINRTPFLLKVQFDNELNFVIFPDLFTVISILYKCHYRIMKTLLAITLIRKISVAITMNMPAIKEKVLPRLFGKTTNA